MKKNEKGSFEWISGFLCRMDILEWFLSGKASSVKDTLFFANVHVEMCPDSFWQPPKGKGRSCLVDIVEQHTGGLRSQSIPEFGAAHKGKHP